MNKPNIFSLCVLSLLLIPQAVDALIISAYTNSIPTVGKITPSTAITDESVTYSSLVTDNDVLDSCSLYVDGEREKSRP
ncbi:MAG: hypothetical protein AAB413_02320 [Patescibacteria group bacterium]